MSEAQVVATPRRRGRPRKSRSQFPGTVIKISSRPRIMVGDVVELCNGCLDSNRGKLAVITRFDDDGFVTIRSLGSQLDSVNLKTGEIAFGDSMINHTKPENLYRRSNSLAPKGRRHG